MLEDTPMLEDTHRARRFNADHCMEASLEIVRQAGCWIDSRTNGTWNLTPQSAVDRVCLLMNQSVEEIDMFILKPTATPFPFPEPFWIPVLEHYVGGKSYGVIRKCRIISNAI
jgi:hypothetical protein